MAQFLWRVFQLAIIFAVIGSNIEWRWTPNSYLAALLGFGAAYVATVLLTLLAGLLCGFRRRAIEQSAGEVAIDRAGRLSRQRLIGQDRLCDRMH